MFAYAGVLQYLFCLLEGKVSSSLLRQDRMEVSIPCVRHFGFTTPFMSNYGLVCLAPVLFLRKPTLCLRPRAHAVATFP